jgi:peptidoglycan/xylan/chitin deacetylase (PgdA/CDA1 family)
MSWEIARRSERAGMTFGCHTVSHPILSRTSDDQARHELTNSWQRLQAEVERPVRVFCYPNGRLEDFGEREIELLRGLGFRGAVVGVPGYVEARRLRERSDDRWRVRRFSWPDNSADLLQYVGGFERFKEILRGAR